MKLEEDCTILERVLDIDVFCGFQYNQVPKIGYRYAVSHSCLCGSSGSSGNAALLPSLSLSAQRASTD